MARLSVRGEPVAPAQHPHAHRGQEVGLLVEQLKKCIKIIFREIGCSCLAKPVYPRGP